ncbi:MAG: hypothetical protein F9B45_32635 [Phycisphaera sp. RhM]|nr:hypothetical protein [Phycisphaera sp. RhM]
MKHKHLLLHLVFSNLALMVVNEQAFKSAAITSAPDESGAVAFGQPASERAIAPLVAGVVDRSGRFICKGHIPLRGNKHRFSAQSGEPFSCPNRP